MDQSDPEGSVVHIALRLLHSN